MKKRNRLIAIIAAVVIIGGAVAAGLLLSRGPDLTGTWKVTYPNDPKVSGVLQLEQDRNGQITGEDIKGSDSMPITGQVKGNSVRITETVLGFQAILSGTMSGKDKFIGNFYAPGEAPQPFTAQRVHK